MQNRRQNNFKYYKKDIKRFKDENGNDLYLSNDEIVTTGKYGRKKYFKVDPNGFFERQIWPPKTFSNHQYEMRKKEENDYNNFGNVAKNKLFFYRASRKTRESQHADTCSELTFFNSAPEKKPITFSQISRIISETGTIEAAAKKLGTDVSELQEIIGSSGLLIEDIINNTDDFQSVSDSVKNITYAITESTNDKDKDDAWAASVLEGSDVSPKSSGPTNTGP